MIERPPLPADMAALNERIERLRMEYTAMHAALRRYGSHDIRCTLALDDYHEGESLGCSCGYEKALAIPMRTGRQP